LHILIYINPTTCFGGISSILTPKSHTAQHREKIHNESYTIDVRTSVRSSKLYI